MYFLRCFLTPLSKVSLLACLLILFFIDLKAFASETSTNNAVRYPFFMVQHAQLTAFDYSAPIYPMHDAEQIAEKIIANQKVLASDDKPQFKSIACHELANIFLNMQLYETAALFADSGLVYLSKDDGDTLRYKLMEIKALSHLYRNDSEAATKVFIELIKLAEQLKDPVLSALNLLRAAAVFTNQDNPDRSEIYLQAAAQYENDERVPETIKQTIRTEQARLHLISGKPDEAWYAITQSDTAIDEQSLAIRYALLAWLPLQDMDSAYILTYLNAALKYAQQTDNKALHALLLNRLLSAGMHDDNEVTYHQQKQLMQDEAEQKDSIRNLQHEVLGQLEKAKDEILVSDPSLPYLYAISYLLGLALLAFIMYRFFSYHKRNRDQFRKMLSEYTAEEKALRKTVELTGSELEARISDRKQVLFNELEERKKVDTELTQALKEAEKANYLKNAFLSNMSHEIRTPLNGILGFSSLLEVELALIDNPELYEYASSIQQSGERLLHLLNNIIDISRIEANDLEMDIKAYEIAPLLDKCIDLYAFKANDKGIRIIKDYDDFSQALYVLTDKNTLNRVLCELLDNAVKYTEKGFIRISLSIENENDKTFAGISIKDTGIGIDETYLPHIFEAFRQESLGYSRLYQGAGLGLPLAHRMMELMGGALEIASQKSVGTSIFLSLPTTPKDEKIIQNKKDEEAEIAVLNTMELKNLNILIVEDDKSNLVLLKKMVSECGEVHTAMDGEQTIKYLEESTQKGLQFDLFLIDINLPAPWDGIKLMHAIRHRWTQYENSLFVAITAYAMIGDRERMIEAGFNDYVPKPVEKDTLIRVLKRNWYKPEINN